MYLFSCFTFNLIYQVEHPKIYMYSIFTVHVPMYNPLFTEYLLCSHLLPLYVGPVNDKVDNFRLKWIEHKMIKTLITLAVSINWPINSATAVGNASLAFSLFKNNTLHVSCCQSHTMGSHVLK